jgi:acylphosphatase
MFEEIEVTVSGKVQNVMYRDFVQSVALPLECMGTVENMPEGTVRVVAQGTPDALKALIDRLHEGSILSRVEDVAVVWRAPTQQFSDFSVIYK